MTNPASEIKFGTDGWRGLIAEDFTYANVARVAQAYAAYLTKTGASSKKIIIGYDHRFLSEKFAAVAAQVLAANGFAAELTQKAVPSQVVSFAVKNENAAGGIMITASHNPPAWNGFKIKGDYGGSAFPEITQAVETELSTQSPINLITKSPETFNPDPAYLSALEKLVNLSAIKRSNITVVVDPMYGSGRGYIPALLPKAVEIRGGRDPLFGGINPEPIAKNLAYTMQWMKDNKFKKPALCIVLDGDADRLGGVDELGHYLNSHHIFVLLLYFLIKHRRAQGKIIKTFNITSKVDSLCKKHGLELLEVPIGFKYICAHMLKEDILMGGEESGGMGIRGHVPERDGILVGLLLLELMAKERLPISKILKNIMADVGPFYYDRLDLILDKEKIAQIRARLKENPPTKIAGKKVADVKTLDGFKFFFADGSWVLFRPSGTEPLLRIYVEAPSAAEVDRILSAAAVIAKNA